MFYIFVYVILLLVVFNAINIHIHSFVVYTISIALLHHDVFSYLESLQR